MQKTCKRFTGNLQAISNAYSNCLNEKDHTFMSLLKAEIVQVMQQSYPGINPRIEEWKKNEIASFQENLSLRINARISEKWFYTHMKGQNDSLPRIDMLHLLSQYCGYANWDDFVFKNQTQTPLSSSYRTSNKHFILVPLIAIGIIVILYGFYKLLNTRTYTFIFEDQYTHEILINTPIDVQILLDKESRLQQMVNTGGELILRTDQSKLQFIVKAPYYKEDTITRIVRKFGGKEIIFLQPDEFSLMLHYLTSMKMDDWKHRKEQLEKIFAEDAMIFQVMPDNELTGLALYSKDEFIRKITLPSESLKNMEILNFKEKEGRITFLRFRIKTVKR